MEDCTCSAPEAGATRPSNRASFCAGRPARKRALRTPCSAWARPIDNRRAATRSNISCMPLWSSAPCTNNSRLRLPRPGSPRRSWATRPGFGRVSSNRRRRARPASPLGAPWNACDRSSGCPSNAPRAPTIPPRAERPGRGLGTPAPVQSVPIRCTIQINRCSMHEIFF